MSGTLNPTFLSNLANPPAASPQYWGQQMQNMNALKDYQAKQAVADITQQSIDPQTGQVDPAKFNLLLSRNPQAAWAGLPAMAAQGQAQSAQATGSTNQLGFNDAQQTQIAKGLGSMINQPDNAQTPEAYKAQLQQMAANRTIDPSHLAAANAAIDALGPNPDPTQMRLTATRMLITGLSTADIARAALPQTTLQNIGNQIVAPTVTPGALGRPATLTQGTGSIATAPTPEWLGETVSVTDNNKTLPDGSPNPHYLQTSNVTRGDLLRQAGIDPNTLGTGGQPSGSPLGTGRLPPALQNPNKPATPPVAAPAATQPPAATPSLPAAAASPPRVLSTAPSTADVETARQAAPRFQAEIDAGTGAQSQQATLGNMLADTAQFTTGPLAGIVGKVRNLAGNLGLNINTEAQSAKESFNKLAAGLANAQGAGSDQRMAVNINANPHEELSPAGVDLVTRQLQGNADYLQARAKLAQQYPNRSDYAGFQQKTSALDPRVFQLSRMTGPQRTTYWNSLDSAAQKQLGAAIRQAKDLGVLGN